MNGYKLDWAYLKYLAGQAKLAYELPCDFKAGGVEVRVEEDDHENLVMSFRGTTFDGTDIVKDIRAIPWYSRELGGWYHKGFLGGARAILPVLVDFLAQYDLRDRNDKLVERAHYILDGHSKGGAEATIVAALMVRLGRPPKALVTYGAPYAGDDSLREWLKDIDGHRVVNHHDPVPHVPWLLARLGVFDHHRGETAIYSGLNSIWSDPRNHQITRYIDALGYRPDG